MVTEVDKEGLTKKCTSCKEWKPHVDFSKNVSSIDGLEYHCRVCKKEKAHDYYMRNREQMNKMRHDHYQKNAVRLRERAKYYRERKRNEKLRV